MALLSTSATSTTIPTDSPYTGWGGAYCIYPAGYIYPDGSGVDNSYGRT